MDDIVEDTRREVEVLLTAWQTAGQGSSGIFMPKSRNELESSASSINGDGAGEGTETMVNSRPNLGESRIRFVISDHDGGELEVGEDEPVQIRQRKLVDVEDE